LALLLQRLPWLLFGLFGGVIADRFNRVRVTTLVELVRAGFLVVLAAAIFADWANIAIVLLALFLLGTAEVFSDTASNALLPSLVDRDDLALANSRRLTGVVTLNQLAGPPVGALLFAFGIAVPFLGQAVLVGFGALMISRLRLPIDQTHRVRSHVRSEIAEGWRWIIHHAPVRTLLLTIFIFNITFGAAWSVLVLFAEERLHLGSVGFGLLTAASAVGGVIGTLSYGWLTNRVSLGNILRVGLIVETLTHLSFALTTSPVFALIVMTIFGAHAFIWGSTSVTVRQRAVPQDLQGRVGSVYALGLYGGLVLGAALGGLIGGRYGVTGPFWFAFYGSGIFVFVIWRQLRHLTDDQAQPLLS
jgi:predicted MFS family arabinose efflux permease